MIDDKSLYQFVLLSYATELTTVEWSRSCSFWSRSHNSVLILISVSVLVLVLHSLVSVLASVSLCSGLVSSLKESTTKIGYLSDVFSVSDAVGLYCLESDRLFFEFILLIAFLVLLPVAAPAQQRSQVISRPEHRRAMSPGCTFFLKKLRTKTQRPPTPLRMFHCHNKTNKAISGQIWYNFYFLFTLLPTQSKSIGRAEPGRWIFQSGHLTWRALV